MLDKVEAKIAELKKLQRDEYYKKKNADLAQWGLTSKKKNKKNPPVVVTDEEYEALIDASSGVGMPTRNGFAKVLNITALIVIAAGIIFGFVIANFHEDLAFPIFLGIVAGSVLVALIFLGLGEALRLLQQIADAQRIEYSRRRPQVQKAFPDAQPEPQDSFTVETLDDTPTHPYNAAAFKGQEAPHAPVKADGTESKDEAEKPEPAEEPDADYMQVED